MKNFVVYSKQGCPFCIKIKEVFDLTGQTYREYVLDVDFSREQFYDQFGVGSTFPRVVVDGELIGGCTETIHWLQENKIV